MGAVATGSTSARSPSQRLPADTTPALRDWSHRGPDGAVQLVGAGRGVPGQEILAGSLDRLGRRVVPLDRTTRLLVRPERSVQRRVLPSLSPGGPRGGRAH